jgi:replicative DNA helicase
MFIVDGIDGMGIRQLCTRVRRHVLKYGIKLVVIDYLQKVRPSERHEKRTYEIGEISSRLKALAVETNVAMLTMAQLNRENTKDKGRPPRLSDLADSGQIERDADLVGLIHRSGSDAKLLIAKQRDGETGIINLNFEGTYCRFTSTSNQEPDL